MSSMSRRGTRGSRRVTVLTAALLCVAVGAGTLAGCSSNNEPEPLSQDEPDKKQEPAPEPEPTKDQTSDEPELPDKLDGEHVRFVLAYYEEYNRALNSGDTERYLEYATDDCFTCQNSAKTIEQTYDQGGRYEGGFEPVVDEEKNLARLGDDTANVTLRFDGSSVLIYKSGDAAPKAPDAPLVDIHFNLVREGQEWKIDASTVEPVEQ